MKFRNRSGRFELQADALRQFGGEGELFDWREATRNSIRRLFLKGKMAAVWGKDNTMAKAVVSWYGHLVGKAESRSLHIGCVRFTPKQTKTIKAWAMQTGQAKSSKKRKK